ncbi:MAG: TraX family protein [Ruminococcus sp.]
MLIDHTASFLLRHYPPAIAPWFQIGSTTYSLYRVMRDVGRAAFPIFCFLLVEGFLHTHNRFKYGRNLLRFSPVFLKFHGILHKMALCCIQISRTFFSPYFWDILHSAWSNTLKNASMQLVLHVVASCSLLFSQSRLRI